MNKSCRLLLLVGVSLATLMLLSACETAKRERRWPADAVPADSQAAEAPGNGNGPVQLAPGVAGTPAGGTAAPAPIVQRGTGLLLGRPTVTEVETALNGDITLNFVNADIREVIAATLGEALKVNYVIDPRVQGTVTIRTTQPLKSADVIPILEDVLAMNGAGLVMSGETYRIVPLEGAASGFRIEAGYGIHILPLRYASADAMSELLGPYVPPGRTLRTDAVRNVLLFAGTHSEARELEQLAQVFDVDWMSGMSFAIYPLELAEAKTVAQELDRVFGQDFEGPTAGIVQFVPIERQNAILVITPQPDYLDKAAVWIERLDRGHEEGQKRVHVYWVQHGNAMDLAKILNDVYGATEPPQEDGLSLEPGFDAVQPRYRRTTRAPTTTSQPLPPAGTGEEPAVEELPASPAVRPAPGLLMEEGIPLERGQVALAVPDERNNALLIMATPSQYRGMLATLRQLDVVPLQVLIEATIAEVRLTDQLRYGLQWFFAFGSSRATLSEAASGAVSSLFPGFSYLYSRVDARVVLNALTSVTDVRIISAPQLFVRDNAQARLQVGDQVPIVTQQAISVTDSDAPLVNTVEYRDTGVILEVIPHVNTSGSVILEIIQEVSDVVPTESSGIDSPTIQRRQISSEVFMMTGETVALGGLIRDRQTEGVSGIPLLSEIPILGNLFKTTSNNEDRTELLVLLTPRVIRNAQDAAALTEELRRRIPSVTQLEQLLAPLVPAPRNEQ
jgi:general secretion pathway protein D